MVFVSFLALSGKATLPAEEFIAGSMERTMIMHKIHIEKSLRFFPKILRNMKRTLL